jgi:hypothetical protein
MIEADSVHSTPPLNSSSIQNTNPPSEARAEKPTESLDLAMLRFVRCLVRYGATLDEVATVVASELDRLRNQLAKKRRRRMTLVGMRLVPVAD